MRSPDLEKIAALTQKLDQLCQEARQLRDELAQLAGEPHVWPEHPHSSLGLPGPAEAHDLETVPPLPRNKPPSK